MTNNSLPVSPCQHVTFVGCYYNTGRTKKGDPWFALDFKFTKSGDYLVERLFQPHPGDMADREKFATQLRDILNTLAGDDLWRTISRKRVGRAWERFYTQYVGMVNTYKGTAVYLKTLPKEKFINGTVKIVSTLPDRYFISKKDNLSYTVLEQSTVDCLLVDKNGGVQGFFGGGEIPE